MSHIIHAIVLLPWERNDDRLSEVNAALSELDDARHQQFGSPKDHYATWGWAGGTKFFVENIWAAAFNHIHLDDVLEALKSANWSRPDTVLLGWMDEYSEDPKWIFGTMNDDIAHWSNP